ncbi:hypothetical protein L6452_43738 [Arctium lappa]|uniref:Uncharacterized protein n=1 Tax=Arctium lappa TaxID=4217 RepID=A0ACB8XDR6_ARCLA|nr:hypothetical protein L6452_43738 [Arctium lappa]
MEAKVAHQSSFYGVEDETQKRKTNNNKGPCTGRFALSIITTEVFGPRLPTISLNRHLIMQIMFSIYLFEILAF